MVVAVTSDTRGPQFESSHRQCYNEHLVITVNCIKKMIVMKKRPAMAHSLKSCGSTDWHTYVDM